MTAVTDGGDFAEFKNRSCPDCGMTEEEFSETGRLGCEYCYEAFYDIIAERTGIARGLRHTGSKPGEKTVDTGIYRTSSAKPSRTRITRLSRG